MRRYIYIHGTPETTLLGQPGSHGCIRMRNADLVELFDRVATGTQVEIFA
jgi:lipoprotein-anchoring transpeptidase ErfK/SrfK